MGKQLAYLCLQATREGQASYAHVHEIIKGLQRRGWKVDLFEPSYAKANQSPGQLLRLYEFLKTQLILSLKIKKFDAIYIRNHFASFPTSFLCKIIRKPIIQEVNGPYEDLFLAWPWTKYFAPLFKWLIRSQLKWSDICITVTSQLKEWITKETGHERVEIISNGANTELFHPEAASNFTLPDNYVVFFGALATWQGIDTMLNAVNLEKWHNNVYIVIVGDGAERMKVENAAKVNQRIIYLGRLPYQQLPGIIANSLSGLSPQSNILGRSNTGLMPLKVFETLACGVPVVVTDFPGQADLVRENKCGLVIPPDNPTALADAVTFLYTFPEKRIEMGQCGRHAIVREHSWDKRAEDTDKALNMILNKSEHE